MDDARTKETENKTDDALAGGIDNFESIGNLSVAVLTRLRKMAPEVKAGGLAASGAKHAQIATTGRSNVAGDATSNENGGAAKTFNVSSIRLMRGVARQQIPDDRPRKDRTL